MNSVAESKAETAWPTSPICAARSCLAVRHRLAKLKILAYGPIRRLLEFVVLDGPQGFINSIVMNTEMRGRLFLAVEARHDRLSFRHFKRACSTFVNARAVANVLSASSNTLLQISIDR